MNKLAHQRLNANFKQSLKYLRLVFNDFFVLALIFLFGALMYWYAQTLKSLPPKRWYYPLTLAIVLWLPTLTGRLATLLKAADKQFLLPQDRAMKGYLQIMRRYSMLLPTLLILLAAGIMWPFALLKVQLKGWNYIALVLVMLVAKYGRLRFESGQLYFGKSYTDWHLCDLAGLLLSSYYSFGIVVYAVVALFFAFAYKLPKSGFDWNRAVDLEISRKNVIYTIFSMFTDVQEKTINIRRRKYLDFLLPKTLGKEHANSFLYRRSLLRNPDYLNLFVRMTVFAWLISVLVGEGTWTLGLCALVSFLTIYQLLPLGNEFDDNLMYVVSPISKKGRGKDLIKVLNLAMNLQWLLIVLGWLVMGPLNLKLAANSFLLLVWVNLLVRLYLPLKVKDME
ncbi:ABC transporter permease [Lactobacillus corticis]|uniref:Multidrug ABC transporter permease protein n=1 Tax=Lactobacillus corticis TaxID=2201249 RepID=A0A916VH54_9LACO|nr:ABC transporter permease [Lactobacillus corticis]GFZ26656.1 multidrug ABC transporter permease protein [Lactobacillus corticis]